ncbi:MAG: 7 8-dihydro-8-oxoguanine-triphosphatase, partial [Ignavibacteria bacterium]
MVQLATLCYVMHEGKTLMLFRNKKPNDYHEGKWNGLGGKFEEGESPEDCAIREVEEESGIKMITPKMKGIITFPMFDNKKDWY